MTGTAPKPFRQVLLETQEMAQNENLCSGETVENIVTDLREAGYQIKRTCDPVDYHRPIAVLYRGDGGLNARICFEALAQTQAIAAADLAGQAGWLVTWVENCLVRSAWFDAEGISRLLTDYQVVNKMPPVFPSVLPRQFKQRAA